MVLRQRSEVEGALGFVAGAGGAAWALLEHEPQADGSHEGQLLILMIVIEKNGSKVGN